MSTNVQLALAVGESGTAVRPPGVPALVSLAEARAVAALAEEAGVGAIRLLDRSPAGHALDPTVVAAYLSGLGGRIGYVAEVPTTHHAPYNAARRALSLDRASGGLFGLALRPGEGDEVSDPNAPQAPAGPAARWSEYAKVLVRLWESFPRKALVGDQGAAVVADDALIAPIDHEGVSYRVAGPLDGPSSVQRRPVLVGDVSAFDPDAIAIDHAALRAVASMADVVVVERGRVAGTWPEGRSPTAPWASTGTGATPAPSPTTTPGSGRPPSPGRSTRPARNRRPPASSESS